MILLAVLFLLPFSAHAILPPDLIVSVGSNLLQILGVIALALTTVYVAVFAALRQGFFILKKYAYAVLMGATLIAGVILYVYISKQEVLVGLLQDQVDQLQTENVILKNNQQIKVEQVASSTVMLTCGENGEEMGPCVPGKEFHGETFVVQGGGLVLELDINRIEVEPDTDVFTEYLYLNGAYQGSLFSEVSKIIATGTAPVAQAFLKRIEVQPASDLSTRTGYVLELEVAGKQIQIQIPEVQGDFVSRSELTYTRLHSSGQAVVVIDGRRESASAYVEKTYSSDAHKNIFFPGYESVDAKTAQFVLWDESGNFYLFDATDVTQAPPQYVSHRWLLQKDQEGRSTKSYMGTYGERTTGIKLGWSLSLPEFADAKIELTADDLFKSEGGRIRAIVSGTVSDQSGSRTIRGIAHIID